MENFSKASKILLSQDGNVISLFNGTNYDEWSEDCRLVLMRKNLWGIVTQMEPEPESETDKLKYVARSQEAYAIITQSIARSHRDCIRKLGDDCCDPALAWNAVAERFQGVTAVCMMLLLFQLIS